MKIIKYPALEKHIRSQSLSYLTAHGFSRKEAGALLNEARDLSIDDPAQAFFFDRHFLTKSGALDHRKLQAFTRVHAIERTVATYRPVLERSQRETAKADITASVSALKAAGFSADEAASFFNRTVKDARAITPHPTEHLSPEGVILSLELVAAAEGKTPGPSIKAVIDKMFAAETFTAVKKSTILEEIDRDTLYAKIHLEGVTRLNRLIEGAMENAYGARVPISTNTALRTWAYDADGKANAEGFAMMAKMSTSTMESFRLIQNLLGEALQQDEIPAGARRDMEGVHAEIGKLEAYLEPVYTHSRHVIETLAAAAPEERAALYDAFYNGSNPGQESFAALTRKFAGLYKTVDSKNAGLDYFSTTLKTLDNARGFCPDNEPLDAAFRAIQSMGFALEKGQTRHNDLVYQEIINRLFHKIQDAAHNNDESLNWILETMKPEEREALRAQPEKSWDRVIKPKRQIEIFEALITAMHDETAGWNRRHQLVDLLYAANPLTYGKDGYPAQTHTLLDRLNLRHIFPLKFEEGIISDAQPLAAPHQRLLAEAFHMPAMKHMPLFEDLLNFGISQTLVGRFARHGGAEAARHKADILTKLGVGTGYDGLHVIVPASDSGKEGGPGARLKALGQYRKIARKALENGTPVQIMLGGGLSLGRFGGDVGIVRRIIAQEMKNFALENDHDFDLKNPQDARLLRMMAAVLYTEQGRANRLLSATPGQICNTIAGRIMESVQDLLDLTGAVPDYTYIDAPAPLSGAQMRLIDALADRTLALFNRLRHARDDNDKRVLDSFADLIRPARLMPFANNGARPASKSGSKGISEERAIGNDQSLYAAQLFHGGFYGLGRAMAEIKDSGQAADLAAVLLGSPDVEYANIVSGLTDALRFNAPALLAKTSFGQVWSFERALKTGQKTDITDGKLLCHEGELSNEEAYLAKIWYDRLLFLAVLEGAATGTLESKPLEELIAAIRPANGGIDVKPGPATLGRWPLALEIVAEHNRNAPGFALVWGAEEALAHDELFPEEEKRSLMGSWRAGTAPHHQFWAASVHNGYAPYVTSRRAHRENFTPRPRQGAPAPDETNAPGGLQP